MKDRSMMPKHTGAASQQPLASTAGLTQLPSSVSSSRSSSGMSGWQRRRLGKAKQSERIRTLRHILQQRDAQIAVMKHIIATQQAELDELDQLVPKLVPQQSAVMFDLFDGVGSAAVAVQTEIALDMTAPDIFCRMDATGRLAPVLYAPDVTDSGDVAAGATVAPRPCDTSGKHGLKEEDFNSQTLANTVELLAETQPLPTAQDDAIGELQKSGDFGSSTMVGSGEPLAASRCEPLPTAITAVDGTHRLPSFHLHCSAMDSVKGVGPPLTTPSSHTTGVAGLGHEVDRVIATSLSDDFGFSLNSSIKNEATYSEKPDEQCGQLATANKYNGVQSTAIVFSVVEDDFNSKDLAKPSPGGPLPEPVQTQPVLFDAIAAESDSSTQPLDTMAVADDFKSQHLALSGTPSELLPFQSSQHEDRMYADFMVKVHTHETLEANTQLCADGMLEQVYTTALHSEALASDDGHVGTSKDFNSQHLAQTSGPTVDENPLHVCGPLPSHASPELSVANSHSQDLACTVANADSAEGALATKSGHTVDRVRLDRIASLEAALAKLQAASDRELAAQQVQGPPQHELRLKRAQQQRDIKAQRRRDKEGKGKGKSARA